MLAAPACQRGFDPAIARGASEQRRERHRGGFRRIGSRHHGPATSAETVPKGERQTVRPLGELEAVVMQRLWEWDRPASVREVVDSLQTERDVAYTTVMTVMDNLHRKQMLTREMHGRAYVYSAARSRAAYSAELIAAVVDDSGDDRTAALLHFFGKLSPADLARIRAALDESSQSPRKKPGPKPGRRSEK